MSRIGASIGDLRKTVRQALEQLGAARMVGDREEVVLAEGFVRDAKLALASALVAQAKESRGVPKADESTRKPAKLP